MFLTADYHTHTQFSHGTGKVIDNANIAKQKGLVELGISDHGFAHPALGLRKRKLPALKNDVLFATEQTGVKVLRGIESNIISISGKTDLKEKDYDNFDIYLAGVHKLVCFKHGSFFPFAIPNMTYSFFNAKSAPNYLIKNTTKAYINVIKNNPVDAITHVNFCCFSNAVEVAKCAADYGTYIELNSKKIHLTDEEIDKILQTKARFIISSDAHSPERVGEISLVEDMIKRLNFPLDRIDNIDGRLPNFRFRAYKEKRL